MKTTPSGKIPKKFWSDVSAQEFKYVIETGYLTPNLKAKLFRMMEYQDPPKGEIKIATTRAELNKLLEEFEQAKATGKAE